MDNLSGNQQQPSSKNARNLSIKEFFTNRLMRARSFEGGAHSPKDETLNWFDEFKARMTKKSLASSSKEKTADCGTLDESNDHSNDFGEHVSKTVGPKRSGHRHEQSTSAVKESCDTYSSEPNETHGDDQISSKQHQETPKDTSNLIPKSRKAIKLQRISCVDSPDFDTASINTVFSRRDSRYEKLSDPKLSRFLDAIKWIISYSLPFNYNLPWKLISLINFTFVTIVIGLASEKNSDITALSFFNGFLCGLLVASLCFVIIVLSLMVRVLPKSPRPSPKHAVQGKPCKTVDSSPFTAEDARQKTIIDNSQKSDEYSLFEVLDSASPSDSELEVRSEVLLDDDDYKGWMIEFIGDYELRNKSDIKLKLNFVKIENRILYLCKPKNNHEAESESFPVFVQQRVYDLNTARKFSANLLLPKNVRNRQKYVWSKKYPIRLEFQDSGEAMTKSGDSLNDVQLTLFAKSCREKEEWFRRFKRIVEENRLSQGRMIKRSSLQSDISGGNDEGPPSSMDSFKHRSTFNDKNDCVQTSRSSHMLNDTRRAPETESSSLVRTKSCELLTADHISSSSSGDQEQLDGEAVNFESCHADDSTLTRETAEIFSQAVEFENFVDSQPNLSYRDYIGQVIESGQEATATSDWFNALTGRIFFDVFSHNYWSVWFKKKIQRKLHRIRLPYFMETLTLTKIDLGINAPQFLNVVSHSFDSFGLSIDFDMAYSGGLTMTFETKLNLLKIKSENPSLVSSNISSSPAPSTGSASCGHSSKIAQSFEYATKNAGSFNESKSDTGSKDNIKPPLSSSEGTRTSGESSDSEESEADSSSDSSFDEADVDEISDWEDYGAEKTRQSIVRFVDKIASSRYFQHATENRYIKKKLQDISNCPLVLVVQIQSLNGVLTLNVPPPQTDRIWYGFKPNPELTLKALPKMGDREVNLSHVTDWIERKLADEFRKILVIPNMEDIVLPVLKSDHLLYVTSTK